MKHTRTKSFIDKYFWHGIVTVILIGGAANLFIWFGPRQAPEPLALPSYPISQVAEGHDIYQANCATCHGADGSGYARDGIPAPALNGSEHAWHHADAQIAGFIRNGVGQMPAVGATWGDDDIDAVLAYVKQWWEPEQLAYQTESSRQNP